jgi:hypothetical protein
VVLIATPYQTAVVALVATPEVVTNVFGEPLAGTAANLVALIAALEAAQLDAQVVPKPPTPETLYPQVLTASAMGVVCVPVEGPIVLPPLTRFWLAAFSCSVSV